MGANVVFMYAQEHPDKVAGFVSMNPVPPVETFLDAAKNVETKAEFADERSFYRGGNDEATSFHEPMLSHSLPSSLPYVVMFDEDCGGDTDFCGRILPSLIRTTRSLATVGDGGRFRTRQRRRARHLRGQPRARTRDGQRHRQRHQLTGQRAVAFGPPPVPETRQT
jgi:pimeloyl-ACP methyl ester carboxylesterase